MKIFTIGFTKKNAETFFSFLKKEKILRLLDVRLNNISQLSGFAKRDDLRFFLRELCGAEYLHVPDLVPTKVMLNSYKKGDISWEKYEDQFLNLMAQRKIEKSIHSDILENNLFKIGKNNYQVYDFAQYIELNQRQTKMP